MADGMDVAGLATFSILVWAMQFKVSMETLTWTWINYFLLALSMGVWYIAVVAYCELYSLSPQAYGTAVIAFSRPAYWLLVILVLGAMVLFDFTIELLRLEWFPTPVDIARELDRGHGVPDADGVIRWGDEDDARKKQKSKGGAAAAAAGGDVGAVGAPGGSATSAPAAGGAGAAVTVMSPMNGVGGGAAGSSLAAPAGTGTGMMARAASRAATAGSSGDALLTAPGVHVGAQGMVMVPHEAVMGGVGAADRARMGVSEAADRSSYDYAGMTRDAPPAPAAQQRR
jgi:hypothetical protein